MKINIKDLSNQIYYVKDQFVMFDFDLANLFGYKTKAFNQQVSRNISKFKNNTILRLSNEDFNKLIKDKNSQNSILGSQIVTANRGGHRGQTKAYTIEAIRVFPTILKGDSVQEIVDDILICFHKKTSVSILNNNRQSLLIDMIYYIRGQKVMLDFELAKYYGYETRLFNEQVKNNFEKFPEDFRFKLTDEEWNSILISKNPMSSWGGRRFLPYAFTEQGVYMLMTVLRGEKATEQSIALIRLFKSMKDYLVENNNLLSSNELLRLSRQVSENTNEIKIIKEDSKEIKEQLVKVMDNFIDPSKHKEQLILNNQRIEASLAYQSIFKSAKKSIILIDDYISLKTLALLKVVNKDISVTIYSDNASKDKIKQSDLDSLILDSGLKIELNPTNGIIHDRYIFIDDIDVYQSGSSLKDSGGRITTITKLQDVYPKVILEKLTKSN